MATTLYQNVGAGASTARKYWAGDIINDAQASSGINDTLLTTRNVSGAGAAQVNASTANGPTSVICHRAISEPLAADVTVSQTISYNVWGLESSMNANCSVKVEIIRLQPNGTVTTIGTASNTTEFGTTSAVRTGNITPSSTNFKTGDCIGVQLSLVDAGGTMVSGFTGSVVINGGSAGVSGDTFVTFTDTLSFATTAPSGSTLYLTDTASDANPGANTEKALQIDGSAPSTFSKATNCVVGPTSPIQATDGAGGTAMEWYTPPLAAVSLAGGVWQLSLDCLHSGTGAASFICEVYKTATNGGSPTLLWKFWGNGNPTDTTATMSITSGDAPEVYSRGANDVSIADGERLKVVLYIDDALAAGSVRAFGVTTGVGSNMGAGTVTFQLGGSGGGYLKLPTSVSKLTITGTGAPTETDDTTASTNGIGDLPLNVKAGPGITNTTAAAGGTASLTLPTRVSGDLLLAWVAVTGFGSPGAGTAANWTRVSHVELVGGLGFSIYARLATNNSSDNLAPAIDGSGTMNVFATVHAISGHGITDVVTEIQGKMPSMGQGSTNTPNPPNATSQDNPVLYIESFGSAGATSGLAYATSGYAPLSLVSSASGSVAVAVRALTATSEDPGTMSSGTSSTWAAATMSLKPAASTPSGTGAPTQANQTATASGTLTITGTGAPSETNDTAAGSGHMRPSGSGAPSQANQTSTATGTETITGTGAPSQANQTATGAGYLRPVATGASTQDAQTASGTGSERLTATGSPTQADQAAAGTGHMRPSGTGSPTQANQTAVGIGSLTITGSGAPSEANDTAVGAGSESFTGSGASTQADQTAIGSGTYTFTISATGTPSQADQTAAGTGSESLTGAGAASQADQTATGAGYLRPSGAGAATQADETGAGSGSVTLTGTGSSTETNDTGSGAGYLRPSGAGASTQADQTAVGSGSLSITGTGAAVQADQTAAGAGHLRPSGTGAATQADETANGAGSLSISGAGAATQANQTGSGAGYLQPVGAGASSQADQTGAGAGSLSITGSAAPAQADQTAAGSGLVRPSGTGASTQADQTATGLGFVGSGVQAIGAATQASQTAAGVGSLTITGSATPSQADQTASGAGSERLSGSAATTQANQTASGAGSHALSRTGSGAPSQANQTAAGVGWDFTGTGASSEATDTASGSGSNTYTITGSGAPAQANQTATATGVERFTGAGASTQAGQSAVGVGALTFRASGSSTQDSQSAVGVGDATFTATGSGATVQADQVGAGIGVAPTDGILHVLEIVDTRTASMSFATRSPSMSLADPVSPTATGRTRTARIVMDEPRGATMEIVTS